MTLRHTIPGTKWQILFFLISGILIAACGAANTEKKATKAQLAKGKEVYTKYCELCHGPDGKLALNGAYDITVSPLTLEERVELIRNGRNLMTPFQGILSAEQMELAAYYSMSLE